MWFIYPLIFLFGIFFYVGWQGWRSTKPPAGRGKGRVLFTPLSCRSCRAGRIIGSLSVKMGVHH